MNSNNRYPVSALAQAPQSAAGNCANNQSEVERELDALFSSLTRLDEVVSMLAGRLAPIKGCYPPETKSENSCSAPTTSSVGCQINTAHVRVHAIARALLLEIDLLAI